MTVRKRVDASALRTELLAPAGPYAAIDVVPSTGSTNADLRAAAVAGAADYTVLLAEEQTSGAGRRGRGWVSPRGSGVYCSVLLRPAGVAFADLGSLAVVAGLAITDVTAALDVDAVLKWPNDVLAGPDRGKCAGVLAESVASDETAVVLGIGLNVQPLGTDVPPGPGGLPATSLVEAGARSVDRTEVAALLLAALADRERSWRDARGDLAAAGQLADYRARCATLGQQVKVVLADGAAQLGTAVDVDASGQLVLESVEGVRRTVLAGDVIHLRAPDREYG
ncbi:BirA family transcriptional regulator, biotin operon repressor / biotin-[acetyl-CoA-carboxylase] ligase [Amycolatopsis arida]|uniref:biotin--[biotin carboxyl-carrier protein] ligase n=1 Tax=Amycolatopsis arida TaxID=587909 RepID=A0A1I5WNT1_9PSEU|nr:biotin--[acetyl-CoA-carboxylase] ligase [Amycolatopsis arida]TDX92375.1 BirA family biotin operon repressor/biotin-[acetyl-CoA-carboxylase] ligase [Amycolatopsis arida]SFQ21452.1 BirA family transcriptional regulator, biotin operon repressor / biotin-[acetyl-CoA-carboxylase] ligase [Amycolatopsis arida]